MQDLPRHLRHLRDIASTEVSLSERTSTKKNDTLDSSGSTPVAMVAHVGAMATMESLVDALLPLGYIPAVVPEFKGITVGKVPPLV